MVETKKTRPGADTPERVMMETTSRKASLPASQFTTASSDRQFKVSDILHCGRENAVSLRYLTMVLQMDDRSVRLRIEQERRNGIPICADNRTGYFLPASDHEKMACVRSMKHRAEEILKTARAIESARGV
ncbi:MAG: hypothetical protein KH050_11585 [Clostridiaceae bacterium]|nr:hypothetical protein [Clostridiaceae bacterium]